MNTRVLWSICLCLTIFVSCENHPQGMPGYETFYVLKFKDPGFKDYILTNDQNGYFASTPYENAMPDGCWETMKGRNPYILLLDEYVLVDWRWKIHWNNPVVVFIPWQERTSWTQHWDTTITHVHDPIFIAYGCVVENFDKELGYGLQGGLRYYPYITNYFSSGQSNISSSDLAHETSTKDITKGMTLDEVENYYDAVYAEIAEQLDSAIAQGRFPLDCMEIYVNP